MNSNRHIKHSIARILRIIKRIVSALKIKYATHRLRAQNRSSSIQNSLSGKELTDYVAIMLSYKITHPERLTMLSVVMNQVKRMLADSGVSLFVVDASDAEYLPDTTRLFHSSSFPIHFTAAPKRLGQAYMDMLATIPQKYVHIQFDDFLTVGLQPKFLRASCELLERYAGLLDVVCIQWPFDVVISDADKCITVIDYCQQSSNSHSVYRYHFGYGAPQIPIFIETIGDYAFGIFENFQYGFFFNHAVVPVDDYRRRTAWYMEHISRTSVHSIELAASDRTVGPFWKHLAICLSGVCLLDIDYAHTNEAVRPGIEHNKRVCEALQQGYTLKVEHKTSPCEVS